MFVVVAGFSIPGGLGGLRSGGEELGSGVGHSDWSLIEDFSPETKVNPPL